MDKHAGSRENDFGKPGFADLPKASTKYGHVAQFFIKNFINLFFDVPGYGDIKCLGNATG